MVRELLADLQSCLALSVAIVLYRLEGSLAISKADIIHQTHA